jgi:Haem-NO-binding
MKGVVFTEFLEMVEDRFSPEMADRIIEGAELASGGVYTTVGTYDHGEMIQLGVAVSVWFFYFRQEGEPYVKLSLSSSPMPNCAVRVLLEFENLVGEFGTSNLRLFVSFSLQLCVID